MCLTEAKTPGNKLTQPREPCYTDASQEMRMQYPFIMAIKGNES